MLDNGKKRKLRTLLSKLSPDLKGELMAKNLEEDVKTVSDKLSGIKDYSGSIQEIKSALVNFKDAVVNKLASFPEKSELEEIKQTYLSHIDLMEKKFTGIIANLNSDLIGEKEQTEQSLKELNDRLEVWKLETIGRFSRLGGGSQNQKISISDTVMSKRYADFNLIGSGVTIVPVDNNTTKQVDITFTASGSTSPLTTKGDIYGHSTVDARIPVGTNGQALLANSSNANGVSWGGVQAPLSFSASVINASNDVSLFNDLSTPGNNYYYGTDGSGTKHWLPSLTTTGEGANILAGDGSGGFQSVSIGQGLSYSAPTLSTTGLFYWTPDGSGNIYNNNPGGVGVGQSTPMAELHVTPLGAPSNVSATIGTIGAPTGYTFGQGSISYLVYSEDSATPVFSGGISTTFTEPPSSDFDPSSGTANFTGGGGYTASGYDFNYTIWALYGGNTQIGVGSTVTTDTGTDPNDGSNYSVAVSWTAPVGSTPSSYLVLCNGSNPNSGQYQVVSGPFTDTSSGWGSSPSFSTLLYTVTIGWTGAPAPVDSYVVTNNNFTTYLLPGNTTSVTDDTSWTSGTPTVTPTAQSKTAIFDGSEIDINAVSYVFPSSQAFGFLKNDGSGNLDWEGLVGGDFTGLASNQILYGSSSGQMAQSSNLTFDGNNLTFAGTDSSFTSLGLKRSNDNSSSGTLNDYSTSGISNLRFSSAVTITGFANGYDGKLLYLVAASAATITLKNQSSSSTAGNKIQNPTTADLVINQNNTAVLQYDSSNNYWNVISGWTPSVYAVADLASQTAAKSATTLLTPLATGMYRISVYLQVTTAATISSVLGGSTGVVVTYTDGDGSVAQSDTIALATTAGAIAISSATNTTATNLTGSLVINAKTGIAIQYAIGYTSSGTTAMHYAAHLRLEAL